MGLIDSIKNFVTEEEEDGEEELTKALEGLGRDYQNDNDIKDIASFVIVVKPKKFTDAEKISRHINNDRAVIMIIDEMIPEEKQRIIDFLSGLVMAKDGAIRKLYQNVYICSPKKIGVIEDPE